MAHTKTRHPRGKIGKKGVVILSSVAALTVLAVCLAVFLIYPNTKMAPARQLQAQGRYEEAIALLRPVRYYGPAGELIDACFDAIYGKDAYRLAKAAPSLKAGSVCTFGSFEQDGSRKNGSEPIEWVVLSKEGDTLFLISKYALDWRAFNVNVTGVTGVNWHISSVREWLNGTFLRSAFSPTAQQVMVPCAITSVEAGETVEDQDLVFLPEPADLERCPPVGAAVTCFPTPFASEGRSARSDLGDGSCSWWVRRYSEKGTSVFFVAGDGTMGENNWDLAYHYLGVRPAIRVDLSGIRID